MGHLTFINLSQLRHENLNTLQYLVLLVEHNRHPDLGYQAESLFFLYFAIINSINIKVSEN